jgi:hypothetical protein
VRAANHGLEDCHCNAEASLGPCRASSTSRRAFVRSGGAIILPRRRVRGAFLPETRYCPRFWTHGRALITPGQCDSCHQDSLGMCSQDPTHAPVRPFNASSLPHIVSANHFTSPATTTLVPRSIAGRSGPAGAWLVNSRCITPALLTNTSAHLGYLQHQSVDPSVHLEPY